MNKLFLCNKQKGLVPILIVLLIALGIGGFLIYQKQNKTVSISQPSPSPVSNPVASDQNQGQFVQGKVIVGIKSGVKVKDAEQLIKSYDLKYKAVNKKLDLENKKEILYDSEDIIGERPFWLTVFVPTGEENKWIKIFESNSIVKYASLSYIYKLHLQNK